MSASPTPTATATPYLCCANAAQAIDWYIAALDAHETIRILDDGRVGHAELEIGGARIMLADPYPELGLNAPTALGATTVTVHLDVGDVDARYARVLQAGATGQRAPTDAPHGQRRATVVDPFGHRWILSEAIGATQAPGSDPAVGPGGTYAGGAQD